MIGCRWEVSDTTEGAAKQRWSIGLLAELAQDRLVRDGVMSDFIALRHDKMA